ncbi:MAG TPA: MEKHLA domain-containing protein [Mariprofundaceae bacterium]|nr:MEKHLA domain-containing protein [Mariprofundaceae bacterium]
MSEVPAESNGFQVRHVGLLLESLARLTGRRPVAAPPGSVEAARAVWQAPFALVSHGVEPDPVFNYGNLTALRLFEMDWQQFTCLPSRLSAEAPNQEERARLLQRVSQAGYIDDYAGIRISSTGHRFRIENAVVWSLTDPAGQYAGQAAMFERWSDIATGE